MRWFVQAGRTSHPWLNLQGVVGMVLLGGTLGVTPLIGVTA
jgi:hypothetical protein